MYRWHPSTNFFHYRMETWQYYPVSYHLPYQLSSITKKKKLSHFVAPIQQCHSGLHVLGVDLQESPGRFMLQPQRHNWRSQTSAPTLSASAIRSDSKSRSVPRSEVGKVGNKTYSLSLSLHTAASKPVLVT